MKQRITYLWHHNRLALLAFAVVICLAGVFGVRTVTQFLYWSDPAKQDQPLAGWMTPRYVGRSYDVPPELVQQALGLTTPPGHVSLETLARDQGVTLETLQARIDAAVAQWRAEQGQAQP
ncbi:MAG: hypothetical protein ACSHW1_15595 [Yoonia sp.]|uniref:hypothetical protein n=1 Tax=Yoonia sp. TaxID=2212373 RepID=UPI003EF0D4AA